MVEKIESSSKRKISVIVPIYNAETKMQKCIESLRNQTLEDIEIILVNDCSTDNSQEVLGKVAEEDSRIVLIQNVENQGTFVSRKRGVEVANSEYIMFADQDDWYELDAFEKLYDAISEKNVDILMYGVNPVNKTGIDTEASEKKWRQKLKVKYEKLQGEHCHKIENHMTWLWNKIVKAEVCKNAFAHSENEHLTFVEDAYGCWLIQFFAKSFETIEEVYYNYDYVGGTSSKCYYSLNEFQSKCIELKKLESLLEKLFDDEGVLEENRWVIDYEYKRGLNICCQFWRDRIAEKEIEDCFNFLCSLYATNDVIKKIHDEWYKVNVKKGNLEIKNDLLKKKNKGLKESTSMKIGRTITSIPRRIKR